MQLRVLGFGLLQDGDVGVGVFPEGEEIFVGGEGTDAGGVCIRALRTSRLRGTRTSYAHSSRTFKDRFLFLGLNDFRL